MDVTDPLSIRAGDRFTLSTGESFEMPVTLDATMAAVIVPADREAVASRLPPGLTPIRAGDGTAPVWLLSVEYHEVADGAIEPYNEFGVILGATHDAGMPLPYLSPFVRTSGYVWYLPVTHEPARAFGDEIWSLPKVVGDIDIETVGGLRTTTVTVDGEHLVTMSVETPPTVSLDDSITAYSVADDTLLSTRMEISGDVGMWPYSRAFSCALGDHPKAAAIREFDLRDRAFARFYASGEFTIDPPQALTEQP